MTLLSKPVCKLEESISCLEAGRGRLQYRAWTQGLSLLPPEGTTGHTQAMALHRTWPEMSPRGVLSPPQGQDALLSDCPGWSVTKVPTRTLVQGEWRAWVGSAFAMGCLPAQLSVSSAPAWRGEARSPGWLAAGGPEDWREREPRWL